MFIFWRIFGTSVFLVQDVHPVDMDGAAAWLFKQVQAAQKSALAGAGRADDGNDLAFFYFNGDVLQYGEIAEFL